MKTLLVTLEIPVRPMTAQEWAEVHWPDEEDEGGSPEDELADIDAEEFTDCIAAALNSENNPDIFAGSGLLLHTDDAVVTSIAWKP